MQTLYIFAAATNITDMHDTTTQTGRVNHMTNKAAWQAFSNAWVNQECLNDGKYPNGQKLKQKDIESCTAQIDYSIEVLEHFNSDYPANVVIARNLPHSYCLKPISLPAAKPQQLNLFA